MTDLVSNFGEELWGAYEAGVGQEPDDDEGAPEPSPPVDPDKPRPVRLANLPEDFWQARERFGRIRQAAWRNGASGDVAFLTVLCRCAAMVSPKLTFDLGRGEGSLSLFGGAIGGTGTGKSTSVEAGQGIVIAPAYLVDQDGEIDPEKFKDGIPLGSGEGLAEAYMGTVERETGEVHKRATGRAAKGDPVMEKVRAQVRSHVFYYVDEGEVLTKAGNERRGTTIWQALRTAWVGGPLGQQNARDETTRLIGRRKYSLGMVVGYQPETVQVLLADGGPGTPQRFLWSSAIDPMLPMTRPDPVRPFWLPLSDEQGRPVSGLITGPQWLADELWATRVNVVHGEETVDQLDSHRDLMRCKVAALLAVIDGRMTVVDEDWQLAGVVWATLCAIRDQMVEFGRRALRVQAEQQTAMHVEREERVHVARIGADGAVVRVARWIGRRVHERSDNGKAAETRAAVRHGLSAEDRKFFDSAFDVAAGHGWVSVDGRLVLPGSARPA